MSRLQSVRINSLINKSYTVAIKTKSSFALSEKITVVVNECVVEVIRI